MAASSSSTRGPGPGRRGRPGPMVDETATDLMYRPLAAAGLARSSSSITAWTLAEQLVPVEGRLADRTWTLPDLVGPVLDPAALELGHGLADVGRHRAGLRVGHQAARAEHAAELADLAHQVGGGDGHVEVQEAPVRPGPRGRRRRPRRPRPARASAAASPAAKTATRAVRPGAGRQGEGAPDDLVGLAGVDAEAHGQLDRLVEPGAGQAPSPGRPPPPARRACWRSNVRRRLDVYFLPLCTTCLLSCLG